MSPVTMPILLAQEYPGSFTVVLVDDRSSDGTAAVAAALAEQTRRRPRVGQRRFTGRVVRRRRAGRLRLYRLSPLYAPCGEGTSCVVELRDATAHAEVMALRAAGAALGRHLFEGSVPYASSEPCPMCLVACYWARVPRVAFGATSYDVATYGFEDLQFTGSCVFLPMSALFRKTLPRMSCGKALPLSCAAGLSSSRSK